MAINNFLFRRLWRCRKYSTYTVDDVAKRIKNKQFSKIVFITGAGISTPSGILDFRTPGTGLYSQLEKYKLPYAEAIFDLNYLQLDPRPFFKLAKELYPGNYRPNLIHYFMRLIQEKNQLLRVYTQNIDGLERLAGIKPDLLVEAHGNFSFSTCLTCRKAYNTDDIKEEIFQEKVPKCKKCGGIIKPDIVFFGEQLPQKFWSFWLDMPETDLLIVMGTSLEVEPFAGIADAVSNDTPRLLINKDTVGSFIASNRPKDVVMEGDLIKSLTELIDKLDWKKEITQLMKNNEKSL